MGTPIRFVFFKILFRTLGRRRRRTIITH
jgi:hypothetical protein